jgi:hypothetical protein
MATTKKKRRKRRRRWMRRRRKELWGGGGREKKKKKKKKKNFMELGLAIYLGGFEPPASTYAMAQYWHLIYFLKYFCRI